MVSRRRILSRSRDDLNLDSTYVMQEEEEDVWYQRDKLYKVRGNAPVRLIGFCLSFVDLGNSSVQFHIRIPRHSSEVNNQLHSVATFSLFPLLFPFLSMCLFPTPLLICFSFRCLMVVGTVTRYQLDGSGIKSRCRRNFPHSGPQSASCTTVTVSHPG